LVQQLGPVLAAFLFSSPVIMGRFYQGQVNNWQSYVAIASILVAFVLYKFHKKKVNDVEKRAAEIESISLLNSDIVQRKRTWFENIWILHNTKIIPINPLNTNDEDLNNKIPNIH